MIKLLSSIQSELKAPKGQYNSFGKYKYRSCEDILEAVKPILAKHDAAVTLSDAIELIGGRVYVKATATLHAESKEPISVSAYAREDETKKGMDGSQITGTASSYARKYALNGLFCIDDTKDSDSNESRNEQEARKTQETAQNQPQKSQPNKNTTTAKKPQEKPQNAPQGYSVNNPTAADVAAIAKDVAKNLSVETDRDKCIRIVKGLDERTQANILNGLGLERIEDISKQTDIDRLFNNFIKWGIKV